jgi:four helix bundle protein
MTYKDFTQMSVWHKSFELVVKHYSKTKSYPPEEKFGMVSDIRRALNSVTHNIAEGFEDLKIEIKHDFTKNQEVVLMN